MDPEEFFHLTEKAIERISGVGYVELRILFKCEQIREIVFQTVVCRPNLLVRVVPVPPVIFKGLFFLLPRI